MPDYSKEVQPTVTYDGRIVPKPVERDIHGEVIPDPSWVAFLKDWRDGKFEEYTQKDDVSDHAEGNQSD